MLVIIDFPEDAARVNALLGGQVDAIDNLPTSPFNETHWKDPKFVSLIQQARAEADDAKRKDILHAAQKMQYDEGGYIIQYFSNIIDAYSSKLGGFVEAKSGFPLGNYWFKNIGFLANT